MLVINAEKRVLVKCEIVYQYNFNTPLKIDFKLMHWDSPSLSSLIFRFHVFSLAGLYSSFFSLTSNKVSAEQVWQTTPSLYRDSPLLSMASHKYSELKHSTRKNAPKGVKSITWSSQITLEAAGLW